MNFVDVEATKEDAAVADSRTLPAKGGAHMLVMEMHVLLERWNTKSMSTVIPYMPIAEDVL